MDPCINDTIEYFETLLECCNAYENITGEYDYNKNDFLSDVTNYVEEIKNENGLLCLNRILLGTTDVNVNESIMYLVMNLDSFKNNIRNYPDKRLLTLTSVYKKHLETFINYVHENQMNEDEDKDDIITDDNIRKMIDDYLNKGNPNKLKPINQWNVSRVTNMFELFSNKELNESIENWNVSNVTNMSKMFFNCSKFNQPLDKWNVSKVTTMELMFTGCSLFDQQMNSWNVSSVTNMSKMFFNCSKFNQTLDKWNVSKVTSMEAMFTNCSLFNQQLNSWNVSNVRNMQAMFYNCQKLNQPFDKWNVSNVENTEVMFNDCKEFNQSLNSWNVAKITNMSGMFSQCVNFDQSFEKWDVSNVDDMSVMFKDCIKFNQPLNSWVVYNVINMSGMFENCVLFNQSLDQWEVDGAEDMNNMFYGCLEFNQPLNSWDVSSVTDMSSMFYNCKKFNQPLDKWDVRKVEDMSDMFKGCVNFDLNTVKNWNFNPVVELDEEFEGFLEKNMIRYDSDASDALNFIKNNREQLTNSQLKININEDEGLDFILGSYVKVSEYLNEDSSNVVFYMNGKVSFFTNKNVIEQAIDDRSAIKYGCVNIDDDAKKPHRENVILNEPYFSLRTIGGYGVVSTNKIQEIINNPKIRCVEISSDPINSLISTASFYTIFVDQNALDAMSASHCQTGQKENVYDLFDISFEITGGKRKRYSRRTKNGRTKNGRTKNKTKRQFFN